jgi:hypothetical protein
VATVLQVSINARVASAAGSPRTRSVIDIRRARLKNCWSMQSAIQAMAATANTNHW